METSGLFNGVGGQWELEGQRGQCWCLLYGFFIARGSFSQNRLDHRRFHLAASDF